MTDAAGWNDFGSRMYWADLGRWFVTDPQRQFGSPYLALGNNPTLGVDPNGEFVFLFLLLLAHSVWFVETRTRVFGSNSDSYLNLIFGNFGFNYDSLDRRLAWKLSGVKDGM